MADARSYPQRPFLAVSAAIMRDGKVLAVRRARQTALNLYTMPGGVVEIGETLGLFDFPRAALKVRLGREELAALSREVAATDVAW